MKKFLCTLVAIGIFTSLSAQSIEYPPYIRDNIDIYADSLPRVDREWRSVESSIDYLVYAEQRYTESPITVYGIAIASEPAFAIRNAIRNTADSIYTNYINTHDVSRWHEYSRLYKNIGDSMVLLGEGRYNIFNTPNCCFPAVYHSEVYDSARHIVVDSILEFMVPVYETYFCSGVTISDTYYIGNTNFNERPDEPLWVVPYSILNKVYASTIRIRFHDCLRYPYISDILENGDSLTAGMCYTRDFGDSVYQWVSYPNDDNYPPLNLFASSIICYPILTPNPNPDNNPCNDTTQVDTTQVIDTTQVDTTQNGIAARLLERYINVYPTVTDGGAVTVLSSFHLDGVEVYDAAGRMLSRQPASGVATTVDVSQLPAGSYVLRINTVSGSTTKKFLKR